MLCFAMLSKIYVSKIDCARLCTLVHTCAHLFTLVHAHLCTLVHTCAHMCTLVHTCAHLCMRTCTHLQHVVGMPIDFRLMLDIFPMDVGWMFNTYVDV